LHLLKEHKESHNNSSASGSDKDGGAKDNYLTQSASPVLHNLQRQNESTKADTLLSSN